MAVVATIVVVAIVVAVVVIVVVVVVVVAVAVAVVVVVVVAVVVVAAVAASASVVVAAGAQTRREVPHDYFLVCFLGCHRDELHCDSMPASVKNTKHEVNRILVAYAEYDEHR